MAKAVGRLHQLLPLLLQNLPRYQLCKTPIYDQPISRTQKDLNPRLLVAFNDNNLSRWLPTGKPASAWLHREHPEPGGRDQQGLRLQAPVQEPRLLLPRREPVHLWQVSQSSPWLWSTSPSLEFQSWFSPSGGWRSSALRLRRPEASTTSYLRMGMSKVSSGLSILDPRFSTSQLLINSPLTAYLTPEAWVKISESSCSNPDSLLETRAATKFGQNRALVLLPQLHFHPDHIDDDIDVVGRVGALIAPVGNHHGANISTVTPSLYSLSTKLNTHHYQHSKGRKSFFWLSRKLSGFSVLTYFVSIERTNIQIY